MMKVWNAFYHSAQSWNIQVFNARQIVKNINLAISYENSWNTKEYRHSRSRIVTELIRYYLFLKLIYSSTLLYTLSNFLYHINKIIDFMIYVLINWLYKWIKWSVKKQYLSQPVWKLFTNNSMEKMYINPQCLTLMIPSYS